MHTRHRTLSDFCFLPTLLSLRALIDRVSVQPHDAYRAHELTWGLDQVHVGVKMVAWLEEDEAKTLGSLSSLGTRRRCGLISSHTSVTSDTSFLA